MTGEKETNLTYKGSGVDYGAMDPFKRAAQLLAATTYSNADRLGVMPFEWTRGESVYCFRIGDRIHGHVEEGLGTKCLVTKKIYEALGINLYHKVSQDTVAMIVNDMITLGIMPVTIAMHLAVGDSEWFKDEAVTTAILEGWRDACHKARCIWGGGETPTLRNIVMPGTMVFSGSATGISESDVIFNPKNIQDGDAIVIASSSGIHANGLTLCGKIAENLPNGYLTEMPTGRTFGETLLDPTHIYVGFTEDCIDAGVDIHYGVNITGHGLRKLMRPVQSFEYILNHLPEKLPIFDFIQKHGNVKDEEMYGNFNMGSGFAWYVPQADVAKMQEIISEYGEHAEFTIVNAGTIKKSPVKKLIIQADNAPRLVFEGETLAVR